ncbi:hypothetical protein FA15DRAFT_589943, partial [Coprinopsis marcescibilis]
NRVDFERLLALFYPTNLSIPSDLQTADEWTSILKLSTSYDFPTLRRRAISELGALTSAVDRIVLAQVHDVREWLVPAYCELVTRGRAVSMEEGERLGVGSVVKIWEVEGELRRGVLGGGVQGVLHPMCLERCCLLGVERAVKAKFGLV